eukprot:CAMPEP_0203951014 /NCGR_PEP_ID=MMETSP0359-20131031/85007_1 /ASSEMBLY_ACC=CAM_ASM_000338 /TAXON_ID=268821 /ORGANISM="Scrippsiella Hangoei, Strain SHTV-5" /LENGTH=51 /DNA_ID=CAMNT_0050883451 /DNA_START=101 /DNA_END=252 /DNA_ORIENTATION=+
MSNAEDEQGQLVPELKVPPRPLLLARFPGTRPSASCMGPSLCDSAGPHDWG